MVDLLAKLQSHQLLSKGSTALLLKIMTDSPTDSNGSKPDYRRVGRSLIRRSEVVGIGTATNDVGVINSKEGVAISRVHCRFKSEGETRKRDVCCRFGVVKAMQ